MALPSAAGREPENPDHCEKDSTCFSGLVQVEVTLAEAL
jgi:hypothetical protein